MKSIKLKNGGLYLVSPDLWEKFSVKKSTEMLRGFEEWCSENNHLMDSGARIMAELTKKEWSMFLACRAEKEM